MRFSIFFFNDTATTEIYTLSLHDALPICTAEHLFSVLGQLKGGAMKMGQALSVFEAALPEELAGPYRAALTKLQEAAPPMPAATVHKALATELGEDWRATFTDFDDSPAAAARIGQVHRATRARSEEHTSELSY